MARVLICFIYYLGYGLSENICLQKSPAWYRVTIYWHIAYNHLKYSIYTVAFISQQDHTKLAHSLATVHAFTGCTLRIHWVHFTHSLGTLYAFTGYTLHIYWVLFTHLPGTLLRLLDSLPLMSNALTSSTASRLLLHITRLLIFGVHSHITEYLIN